jgi:hypothetical protein
MRFVLTHRENRAKNGHMSATFETLGVNEIDLDLPNSAADRAARWQSKRILKVGLTVALGLGPQFTELVSFDCAEKLSEKAFQAAIFPPEDGRAFFDIAKLTPRN